MKKVKYLQSASVATSGEGKILFQVQLANANGRHAIVAIPFKQVAFSYVSAESAGP